MRMQKEEKVVVILLFMALGSLGVAFWAFDPDDGAPVALSGSPDAATGTGYSSDDQTMQTMQVIQGQVLGIKSTKTGGNLILHLNSTTLPIFIPSSAGAQQIENRIQPGDIIQVKGSISDYQGEKELKVSRAGDVQEI